MLVKINFTRNFFGIVYANTRESTCRILGNGGRSYELHIPLNACGTKKVRRSTKQILNEPFEFAN